MKTLSFNVKLKPKKNALKEKNRNIETERTSGDIFLKYYTIWIRLSLFQIFDLRKQTETDTQTESDTISVFYHWLMLNTAVHYLFTTYFYTKLPCDLDLISANLLRIQSITRTKPIHNLRVPPFGNFFSSINSYKVTCGSVWRKTPRSFRIPVAKTQLTQTPSY